MLLTSTNSSNIFSEQSSSIEDVNNDGTVTSIDLLVLKSALLNSNTLTEEQKKSFDLNLDKKFNILDILQLKQLLLENQDVSSLTASMDSGFYDNDFIVSLLAPKGEKIYYTLDGTQPTKESDIYDVPIKITNCNDKSPIYSNMAYNSFNMDNSTLNNVTMGTILRAVLMDEDGNITQEIKRSYFVGIDVEQQYNSLPIISLIGNPDDLFGEENGVLNENNIFNSGK